MTLEQTKKFTEQDENTLQYYNQNATKFIENTKSVEFHSVQDKFLSYLSAGSYILDFGCGSGRDSKYFLEKGYRVLNVFPNYKVPSQEEYQAELQKAGIET